MRSHATQPMAATTRQTAVAAIHGAGADGIPRQAKADQPPVSEGRRIQVAGFYIARNRPIDAERELKEGIAKNAKSFQLRFALSDNELTSTSLPAVQAHLVD